MMMMIKMIVTNGGIMSSIARHPLVCSPSVSKIIVPPCDNKKTIMMMLIIISSFQEHRYYLVVIEQ